MSVFGVRLKDDRPAVGCYHHVLGLDLSSSAPVSESACATPIGGSERDGSFSFS